MEAGGEEAGRVAAEQRHSLWASAGRPEGDEETLSRRRRTITKLDRGGLGECVFVLLSVVKLKFVLLSY